MPMMIRRMFDALGASVVDGRQKPSRISPGEVIRAYRLLFGREPENRTVISQHVAAHQEIWSLLASLMTADEFHLRASTPPLPKTSVDWQALLARFQQQGLEPRPGYVTDFLGIQTNLPFLNAQARLSGYVEGLPLAGGFHCSAAEWIAALRGVELAGDDFVAVELGAGWGAWMAALCRAAQIQGASRTRAIGCEADELHCQMVHEHLENNGFSIHEYQLFSGAVGPVRGVALFPVSKDSSNDWGMRPIFCSDEAEADEFVRAPHKHADYRGFKFGSYGRVPCFTLPDIIAGVDHVDVMHIDIQGGEFDLVAQNLRLLNDQVGYLAIGTHSRSIEGRLIDLLNGAGWGLEVEEPCTFDFANASSSPCVDGIQGWRNKKLRP